MRFEINWGFNVEFPWLDKIHDYVWSEDEDEDEKV